MLNTVSLNGNWQLTGFDEGQGDWTRARSPYPIDAPVPGEVHPALEAAGIIPDPFWGMNSEEVQWVEQKEWWYRRTFRLPKGFLQRRAYLEFDGLDTLATVYLNGEEVGSAQNMFLPHRYDVTGRLDANGENTVEVVFQPVMKALQRMNLQKGYYVRYNPYRIGARKMQAAFGWDWNPRLLGAGIWRDARVVSEGDLSMSDLHVRPCIRDGRTRADIFVDVENRTGIAMEAELIVRLLRDGVKGEARRKWLISACGDRVHIPIDVPGAELWWPNGLGDQALYDVEARLSAGGVDQDVRDDRFGFRTVELRERDDDGNPRFYFLVNGSPVFMKGANWIPLDSFPSRISDDKYRHFLSMARDSHYNMFRVWGGGAYERDVFYRLCDEYGILIWQDFMFALADYPGDDPFTGNCQREAESVIRRLRNHPCVAAWCSNSECELDKEVDAAWSGKQLMHEIIPRAARDLDGTRPIWFSSPYGGDVAHSEEHGTYHGEPWFHIAKEGVHKWQSFLNDDHGLFMAEFPTQGVPAVESLRRFIPEEDLWPPEGDVWECHTITNAHRKSKTGQTSLGALKKNVEQLVGEARNLEEWARMGGLAQGMFLQSQIEFYRRHKFEIGGAMLWMYGDAWPAVDYSIVDYYGRPKPAWYYVKRAYAPVLLCFSTEDDGVAAWVVNDTGRPVSGRLRLTLLGSGGDAAHAEEAEFAAPPHGVVRAWTGEPPAEPRRQCWIGRLDAGGALLCRAAHCAVPPRDLKLPDAKLRVDCDTRQDGAVLRLSTDRLARCVSLEGLPDHVLPDDNYFDLFPDDPREIRVPGLDKAAAEALRVAWGLRGDCRWPAETPQGLTHRQ